MQNERIDHDEAIDRTLAALRGAALPEGMEARIDARIDARIAQRLQQPATPAGFRWRDLFTGTTLAAVWGRGALSGAAFTLLLICAVMLVQHGLRGTPRPMRSAVKESASTRNAPAAIVSVAASLENDSSREALTNPCANPDRPRVRSVAPDPTSETLRAEGLAAIYAPSHPAPVLPLTAQERALVELMRTADPKVLAALAPETQAKVDAQEEENFNKFFAPPPAPPTTDANDKSRTTSKEGEQI